MNTMCGPTSKGSPRHSEFISESLKAVKLIDPVRRTPSEKQVQGDV